MAVPASLVLLRFREPDINVLPSDEMGSLNDLNEDAATGFFLPPVVDAFTGKGRSFGEALGLVATDVVPGASLATRDVTIRALVKWDPSLQHGLTDLGAIVIRGKGNVAAEYVSYGLELRVVNEPLRIGEVRFRWQDTAGNVKIQQGGQFIAPASGFMMLTAVRRWISSSSVEIRYYAGDRLLAEFVSADGDIGGGTTGSFSVGVRYNAGLQTDNLVGVIDELQVLNYELSGEEIAATWDRISRLQPRGYKAMKDLLQPGAPVTSDPTSRFQKLLRIAGQAIGYAAAQVENFRQNQLVDRAYGAVLEQWERNLSEAPRAGDGIDRRRKRLLAHLRQRAGTSIKGVATTVADLLALATSQVQVLAFSQSITDDFSAGIRTELWRPDPTAQWTIASNALRVQAANAANILFDGSNRNWQTFLTAARGSRSGPIGSANTNRWFDGRGCRILAKIAPTTLPDKGEVGVVFYDWAKGNALFLGLRNNAGVYQVVTEAFRTWVSQGVTIQLVSALATHWLHLRQIDDNAVLPPKIKNHVAAWSTTSGTSGFTDSALIQHPQEFQWMGLYARGFGASLAGTLDVAFDDVEMRHPYSDRPFHWFVFRDPALAGSPDMTAAAAAIKRLRHAHTDAKVIKSKSMLAGNANCLADQTPQGGF